MPGGCRSRGPWHGRAPGRCKRSRRGSCGDTAVRGPAPRPLREPLVTESWASLSLTPVARCHPSAGCSRGCRWRNPPPPACRPSSRSRCLRDGRVSWGSGGSAGGVGADPAPNPPAWPCHAVSTGSSPAGHIQDPQCVPVSLPGPVQPPPPAPAPARGMPTAERPGQLCPRARGIPACRAAPGRAPPSPPTRGRAVPAPGPPRAVLDRPRHPREQPRAEPGPGTHRGPCG